MPVIIPNNNYNPSISQKSDNLIKQTTKTKKSKHNIKKQTPQCYLTQSKAHNITQNFRISLVDKKVTPVSSNEVQSKINPNKTITIKKTPPLVAPRTKKNDQNRDDAINKKDKATPPPVAPRTKKNKQNRDATTSKATPPLVPPRKRNNNISSNITIQNTPQSTEDSGATKVVRAKDVIPEMIPGKVEETPNINDLDTKNKEILGAGAFGTVFIAKNKAESLFKPKTETETDNSKLNIGQLRKTYVVKDQLHNHQKNTKNINAWKKGIEREITIQNQVKDAIPVTAKRQYTDEKGDHYQIMMPHGGATLEDAIKPSEEGNPNPIPENSCRIIIHQLLTQLVGMHKQGIGHLDIKPANVLINNQGKATLVDFGVSRYSGYEGGQQNSDETKFRGISGTPLYMAPEVYNTNDTLNPRTYYSEKADCWSMGIMMAELLTGIHPHDLYKTAEGTDFKQLDVAKYAELITHINHNKNLSQDTKDLIMNLLNVNPKFRYSAEKALESPFFNEHMSKEDKNTVYELQIQHQEKFKELANLEQDLEQAQKNPNSNALDIKYLNQSIEITGNEVKALQAEMKGIELLKEKTELEEKINISSKKKKKDIMHLDFLERDYLVNKLTITHCRDITDLEFKYEKEDLEEKINSLRDKPGSEPEIKQLQQQANQAEIKLNLVNMERELQILNIEKYFYQKHRKEISKIYKNKDKNKSENKGKLQNINERISNISDNRNKLLFKVNKFENENE